MSLSAAPPGPTYTTAQTVTLTASASDNVGVTKVEFYDGATLVATDTSTPYLYLWSFTSANNGTHQWTAKAYDAANNVGTSTPPLALTVNIGGGTSTHSLNSTSQSCGQSGQPGCGSGDVSEQPAPASDNSDHPASGTGLTGYQIVAVNDLGMHCGDLDTRVLSILPPFNVLNVRVLQKPTHSGGGAVGLDDRDVEVYYSAASNSSDPVFGKTNPPGFSAPAGSVYKTNFWDTARPRTVRSIRRASCRCSTRTL